MSSKSNDCSRRDFFKLATLAGLGATALRCSPKYGNTTAKVGIYKADSYQTDLTSVIRRGLRDFPQLQIKDKRIVLKPNLVEYFDSHKVNTNPMMVAAAAEAFRSMGAREVIVAEGPGHRRDTEIL